MWVFTAQFVEHCSINAESMRDGGGGGGEVKFAIDQIGITTAMITSPVSTVFPQFT